MDLFDMSEGCQSMAEGFARIKCPSLVSRTLEPIFHLCKRGGMKITLHHFPAISLTKKSTDSDHGLILRQWKAAFYSR